MTTFLLYVSCWCITVRLRKKYNVKVHTVSVFSVTHVMTLWVETAVLTKH